MSTSYQLPLKNEKSRVYRLISRIIVLMHICFFAFIAISTADSRVRIASLVTAAALLLILLLRQRVRFPGDKGYAVAFLICFGGWLGLQQYFMAAIPLLCLILEKWVARELRVSFATDSIRLPSFPPRVVEWQDMNNIILRDGLLTLDFKTNKIMQHQLVPSCKVDEQEFNEFCRQQLKR